MSEIDKPDQPPDHRQMALPIGPSRGPQIHPHRRRSSRWSTYSLVSHFLGWLLIGLTIWVAAFFRDPIRTTPTDPKLIVAPADGLVTMIADVAAAARAGRRGRAFRRA